MEIPVNNDQNKHSSIMISTMNDNVNSLEKFVNFLSLSPAFIFVCCILTSSKIFVLICCKNESKRTFS